MRLFRGAPEALYFQASYQWRVGWSIQVRARAAGESWEEGLSDTYEALSTEELADVLVAVLELALEPSRWPTGS